MWSRNTAAIGAFFAGILLVGCPGPDPGLWPDGGFPEGFDGGPIACVSPTGPCDDSCLRINEVLADNEGVWLDEALETEDLVELVNAGDQPIELRDHFLGDKADSPFRLPAGPLAPGARRVFFFDDEPEGPNHLPAKLRAAGDSVILWSMDDGVVDCVETPSLGENEVLARHPDGVGELKRCGFGSPDRPNGEACGPPPPPDPEPSYTYADYTWPQPFPAAKPLALNELSLRGEARFVELWSDEARSLDGYRVVIAAHHPGLPWPGPDDGLVVMLDGAVDAGFSTYGLPAEALGLGEAFEGVATLYDADLEVLDRVDFMRWPEGATMARRAPGAGPWRLCANVSPGLEGPCDPLASRPVGDRLRRLLTPADHGALSDGGTALGMAAVKVVVDRQAGGVVHLLSSRRYDLHFTFVREAVEGYERLDRCDPEQNEAFVAGWRAFSEANYYAIEDRRFYLTTLVRYASNGLSTMEFVTGDAIIAPQLLDAFTLIAPSLAEPERWALRPQGPNQHQTALSLEGLLPIVAENAPFVGIAQQPMNAAVGFGELRVVPMAELPGASLGPSVILLTDLVPNELPIVGGLITEAFQTPLAHVNLLARNRDTPNMALREARNDPRVAPLIGQLVRFEVRADGFDLRAASAEEAQAFWDERRGDQPPLRPRLDTTVRGIQDLGHHSLISLPALGAKAAGLAQLARTELRRSSCAGEINTPDLAFALPVVHSLEHLQASGALAVLERALADPASIAQPAAFLAQMRAKIVEHPVAPGLIRELMAAIQARWGEDRVRLRSSSNTEDLPGFNGAGLYRSVSVAIGNEERPVEAGLKEVWASLWTERAFAERQWFNVDQSRVAMGVLVHEAFRSEQANGVGISRNILDPRRGDIHFMTVQAGEASVTNPAAGVQAESFLYRFGRSPAVVRLSDSSLTAGEPVLRDDEIITAICSLAGIHDAFRPLLDPAEEQAYFAMDIEFKLLGDSRRLLVKQARPYSFGGQEPLGDCREF